MNEGRPGRTAAYLLAPFVLLGLATAVHAEDRPRAVVELFTSQWCNSCPPADELFGELAGRDDLVALAYHVDYWDYLGWKDAFASPENTHRQQAYAEVFGGSVYTPQIVIDGSQHVVGSERANVETAVAAMLQQEALPVGVSISSTSTSLLIRIDESNPVPVIWVTNRIEQIDPAFRRRFQRI